MHISVKRSILATSTTINCPYPLDSKFRASFMGDIRDLLLAHIDQGNGKKERIQIRSTPENPRSYS